MLGWLAASRTPQFPVRGGGRSLCHGSGCCRPHAARRGLNPCPDPLGARSGPAWARREGWGGRILPALTQPPAPGGSAGSAGSRHPLPHGTTRAKTGRKSPKSPIPPFPTRLHRAAPVRLQPPGSLPRGRFATASLPIFSGWDFSQRPHRCSPWRAEMLAHACHPSRPTHPFRHFVSTNYSPAHGLGGARRGQAACLGASHPCRGGGLAASPHPHPKKNPSCPRCSFGWGALRPPGAPRGAVG